MAKVEVGWSAPSTVTAERGRPISSSASRSAVCAQVGVLGVAPPTREGDLAGVAAQVVAAAGEHDVQLARRLRRGRRRQVQRHEHGGGHMTVQLEPAGLIGVEQHAGQRARDRLEGLGCGPGCYGAGQAVS